ncbi:VOC family protein [Micromonospora sp. NPDC093244]|uniref:VOC family protein n=1 Tax=Micromonospora sp. NPDC093244 TaxID=3155071 RepID=UPI00343FF3AB
MTINVRHDHVGITVAPEHLDTTIAWYAEKLDFTVTQQFHAHGSTFTFMTNGDTRIEIISAGAETRNRVPTNLPASHDVERLHHFCVAVENLDDVLAQLLKRDVTPIAGPMHIDRIGRRIAFVTDNVGTIIELTTQA